MEFELELYHRYLDGVDEDETPMSFKAWLAWSSEEDEVEEEAEDYEDDYDLEVGFDPYAGCYTWDC